MAGSDPAMARMDRGLAAMMRFALVSCVLTSRCAKRALLCAGAVALLPWPEAALAEARPGPAAAIVVTGTLDKTCSAQIPAAQTVSLTSTDPQPVGAVAITCNYLGTLALRLWSLNGGALVSPASAENGNVDQRLTYTVTLGEVDIGQPPSSAALASSLTRPSEAPGVAQIDTVTLRLARVSSVAGVYTDTLSLSVTP